MKIFEKTFPNPLLALAFIDGIEWNNDPDIKCHEPRCVEPYKWIVRIEDATDDDDDVEDAVIAEPEKNEQNSEMPPQPPYEKVRDEVEARYRKMTLVNAKPFNPDPKDIFNFKVDESGGKIECSSVNQTLEQANAVLKESMKG